MDTTILRSNWMRVRVGEWVYVCGVCAFTTVSLPWCVYDDCLKENCIAQRVIR